MKRALVAIVATAGTPLLTVAPTPSYAADPGVGSLPQGTQSDPA